MARLSHPNVVTVHDVGQHEGSVFLAMEFIDGQTLTEWMEKPHDWSEALLLFIQAGRGLAAAHAADLVHRDFKPDNVLVSEVGRVCVLDFGLARSETAEDPESFSAENIDLDTDSINIVMTRRGAVMGTPKYMAPEQHLGLTTDARTDQFSFCVALYEAVYGARPFPGETLPALVAHVTSGEVADAPAGVNVPSWLRRVLLRGLSVDPADRWRSMDALLSELSRDPTKTRTRWLVGLGGVAIVGGALGFNAYSSGSQDACRDLDSAITRDWKARRGNIKASFVETGLPYAEATWKEVDSKMTAYADDIDQHRARACRDEGAGSAGTSELLARRVTCLDAGSQEFSALADVLAKASVTTVERAVPAVVGLPPLDPCEDSEWLLARVRPPVDPQERSKVEEQRAKLAEAKALSRAGNYADAVNVATGVLEAARETGYQPLIAEVLGQLGSAEASAAKYREGEEHLRQAYFLAGRTEHDEVAALAANNLAFVVGENLERFDEGLAWAQQAQMWHDRAQTGPREAGKIIHTRAVILSDQGKYDEALELHQQALAWRERELGPEHPDVANSLNALAGNLRAKGDFEASLAHYERALQIRANLVGVEHPHYAVTLNNMGTVLDAMGRREEALDTYGEALRIREKTLGPDHLYVSTTLINMATIYSDMGRFKEALENYTRAAEIAERTKGPQSSRMATVLNNRGAVHVHLRNTEQAMADFEQAHEIWKSTLGPDHPHTAMPLANMGDLLSREERFPEAKTYITQALEIWVRAHGEDHPRVAAGHNSMASLHLRMNRLDEAERSYTRASEIWLATGGADHPSLANTLHGLAEVAWKRGQVQETIEHAERSVAISTKAENDPLDLAEAQFLLARALWKRGKDRPRAAELAASARDSYADAGERRAEQVAEIEAWLGNHSI
jgi:tetratricopeptide (TPR) repeat protein